MIKILVVDDAAFLRVSMRIMLEQNGFQVIGEAEDGFEGYRKYIELKPDIVTMDITMPKVSGVEAIKMIRDYDPKAKIVVVTAMGQESMVRDAVVAGAKSFIVKPFQTEHITKTLNRIYSNP